MCNNWEVLCQQILTPLLARNSAPFQQNTRTVPITALVAMSEKKRKASSAPESRAQKKQQTSPATVEHVQSSEVLRPIIGTKQ